MADLKIKKNPYFRYFQPNKKDTKNQYGDCSFRALCGCLDKTWTEIFDMVMPICRAEQCWPDTASLAARNAIFCKLGLKYHPVKIVDHHRITVKEFAKAHRHGRFVLRVAGHLVSVVHGQYLDTWDSGSRAVYGYYEKT